MFHGKKIVVVMPAYNAAQTIERTYREIPLDLVDAALSLAAVRRLCSDPWNPPPPVRSLHYFRGMKFKDLGEMLGVSEPRISQLHSRAMSRLKVILAEAA